MATAPRNAARPGAGLCIRAAAMVLIGLLSASLTPAAIAQIPGAEPTRVAYIDMQRLLEGAPQLTSARTKLEKEFAERDRGLAADADRLTSLRAQAAAAKATGDGSLAQRLTVEGDTLERAMARSRDQLRSELDRRTAEEIDAAWPALNDAVAAEARSRDIDLVLQSPVMYVSGRIDITQAVLERLRNGTARDP